MSELNKDDLIACRDDLNTIINNLMARRTILFQQGLLSQEKFDSFGKLERKLIEIKDGITLKIIDDILVKANGTRNRIEQATAVVNQRIKTLDDINEVLRILSHVIDLFGGILGGISTGTIPDLHCLLKNLSILKN
jgi:hypothetical protein